MTDVKKMTLKGMLGMINIPSLNCMMMTPDAKQEILSRFAELKKERDGIYIDMNKIVCEQHHEIDKLNKMVELMAIDFADEICDDKDRIIKHFGEKADES